MKLSIIIPVYNGAATIGRCLDSIYSQGLNEAEFEVICVDDCSSDPSSVKAIEEYQYKSAHPNNLKLIRHTVNKRQGGARNTGIRAAKGTWIMSMDCDDYLIEGRLALLMEEANKHSDLDFILFDYYVGNEYKILEKEHFTNNVSDVMTGCEYHQKQNIPAMIWTGIYKRKCWYEKSNLWLEENTRFEDLDFMVKFIIQSRFGMFMPVAVYFYYIHPGQSTDIGADKGKIKELFLLSNRVAKAALEFKEMYPINSKILLTHASLDRLAYVKRDLWKIPFKDRIEVLKEVRLSFDTGNKKADFVYSHPVVTSLLLCFLNKPIVNLCIRIKNLL